MRSILILGAYGNFGKRIASNLAPTAIPLILGGRNCNKLEALVEQLKKTNNNASISTALIDIETNLTQTLHQVKPTIVINTCGPFQHQNYEVAKQCINQKIHYIDLADGRAFVNGITELDALAKQNDVVVISGASTVPALSSAVIDKYSPHFSSMDSLHYGITPGQKTERGLATTKAILSYVGRPIKTINSKHIRYGWQDLYLQTFPELGKRWMANCDIPDLDLFPQHYAIKSIQFSAGLENPILHLGLWLLSWGVRLGLPLNLSKQAARFLKISHYFDRFGTHDGGMNMFIKGKDKQGNNLSLEWFIIAKDGDGPHIPTIPAVLLAQKLAKGELKLRGALPCVGLISLDEYLVALQKYKIDVYSKLSV